MMKVLAYYLQGGVDIGTDDGLWILHKGSLLCRMLILSRESD
jgi:hypothetical protein